MKTGTLDKLKFKLLRSKLHIPLYSAVGLLEGLWYMTAGSAPDGAIGRFSNAEIAAWLEWDGDADALIQAMVASRFLDSCKHRQDYRLLVHDWHDHCPNHIKNNMKRWGKEFAKDVALVGAEDDAKDGPKDGPSKSIPVQSSPSQSSQTQPIPKTSGVEETVLDLRSPEEPPPAPAKPAKTPGALAFEAYARAYEARYHAQPVRNAKVNTQFSNLVKRLGEEAADVAGFYPTHKSATYVRSGHGVDLLLRDCEKLRTEWATGRQITETGAKQSDRAGTTLDHVNDIIAEQRRRDG